MKNKDLKIPERKKDGQFDLLVIKKLAKISEDIIRMDIKKENTLDECMQMFYSTMRKHGLKKYKKTDNGYTGDNYEWSICRILFEDTIKSKMWSEFLLDDIPKDLMY